MTTIITRLYDSDATAKKVADSLSEAGIRAGDVSLIGSSKKTAAKAIAEAGLSDTAAKAYAAKLKDDGNALVVVRAPFGMAARAYRAVDAVPSIDAGIPAEVAAPEHAGGRDGTPLNIIPGNKKYLTADGGLNPNPTPFSSMFGMRLLSEHKPKDLVKRDKLHIMGEDNLMTGRQFTNVQLREDPTPLSSAVGWATLKAPPKGAPSVSRGNPTPLSSMLGWKTLTD